ncbi:hypothetical protein B0T16DRAFT_183795 [Cercophora newfieldiana]|uniref:Required for respiratory growth protein 7, mitochondrial n=1 Tax=Cercophora newfieldiana TaxID=92897 RepID=A0AA39Y045_9PEZI|nr:hypothetical protein B0T16DRAFT_183795 [Cercophora newfieldiana]
MLAQRLLLKRAGTFLTPKSARALHFSQRQLSTTTLRLTSENGTTSEVPKAAAPANTLIYPEAPSAAHHNLATFLDYAERTGLDHGSTTFVGTHFEYTAAAALSPFGFRLRRIGGLGDFGIDLLGTWSVPSSSRPLHVLLQCKAVKRPRPHLVRELEGAFVGAPAGWRGPGVLGLLVVERPATKGMRDALGRSRWPMGCISCSRAGAVEQILWNRRAEEEGLAGLGVGTRYSPDGEGTQQLVLTFNGKHLTPGGDKVASER